MAAVLMDSLLLLSLFSASTPEFLPKIQLKFLEAIPPHSVRACSGKKFKIFIRTPKDSVPKRNVCHHDHEKPLKSLSHFFSLELSIKSPFNFSPTPCCCTQKWAVLVHSRRRAGSSFFSLPSCTISLLQP